MKDFKKVYDVYDVVENAGGKLYKIEIDGESVIWVEEFDDFFSVYWEARRITKKQILNFIDSSLKESDFLSGNIIIYMKDGAQIKRQKMYIPFFSFKEEVEKIINSVVFLRIDTDDFAITADLIKPKHREFSVMGVIINKSPIIETRNFLAELIVGYFKFSHKKGRVLNEEDIKKFKIFILKEIF